MNVAFAKEANVDPNTIYNDEIEEENDRDISFSPAKEKPRKDGMYYDLYEKVKNVGEQDSFQSIKTYDSNVDIIIPED